MKGAGWGFGFRLQLKVVRQGEAGEGLVWGPLAKVAARGFKGLGAGGLGLGARGGGPRLPTRVSVYSGFKAVDRAYMRGTPNMINLLYVNLIK